MTIKKAAKKTDSEREVKRSIWKEFGAHQEMRIVLYDHQVGLFQTPGNNPHPIKIGEVGDPDLWGYICLNFITQTNVNAGGFQPYVRTIETVVPVTLYIETKRKGNKGDLSKEQRAFQKAAIANGCIHIVADSVEDVYAGIEEYLQRTGATV